MLFLLWELYDPAVHLSNQEYLEKHDTRVDVQSKIESPHLYMLGVSGSSDANHLMFLPTRRECLMDLSTPISTDEGIRIQDKMRMMNGDSPAVELEDGTQKGGHKGCTGCDMRNGYDYEYMTYRPYKSLQENQALVLNGIFELPKHITDRPDALLLLEEEKQREAQSHRLPQSTYQDNHTACRPFKSGFPRPSSKVGKMRKFKILQTLS
ncbi:hypothetical protein AC249_AIPGENE6628 [Exaiptasia diaphana]|nr:hypothetical protein AC249_AIPGENE6628 [Exaiptasia diaphana]